MLTTKVTVLFEVVGLIAELDDLSGAHECEVEGVGEEDHVLSLVVVQANLLEGVNVPRHALKVRGGLLDASFDLIVEGGREAG